MLYKCREADPHHYIQGIYSQLNPAAWVDILYDRHLHVWDQDAHFLLDGVFNGFQVLDNNSDLTTYHVPNYNSCFDELTKSKISKTITSELSACKLSIVPNPPSQIHALGAIPKSNGDVRIITDCSEPKKQSVNNYMKQVFSRFSYNQLDDVIPHIMPGYFMATVDLQSAYRAVPIHPKNRENFGLSWNFGEGDVWMTDNFLGFGTKVAPFIFNRITDSISRHMSSHNYTCFNYLDDFIIIGSNYEETKEAQLYLIATLRRLGFYISWPKTTSPSTLCKYLGILINSEEQTLSLPNDKLNKLHRELKFWSNRKTSTHKQMQILCGILNYCCKVIRGGRIYMHHMIKLLRLFNHSTRITLPAEFFDDLSWWREFSVRFNGEADFFDPVYNTHELFTDACLTGIGGHNDVDYFTGSLHPSEYDDLYYYATNEYSYKVFVPISHYTNINVLELVAVLVAINRWESRILINCDNLQVCYMLTKDRSSNDLANNILKSIFWWCVSNNTYISPCYLPSSANGRADTLSRTC